jgi:hypothetical protein
MLQIRGQGHSPVIFILSPTVPEEDKGLEREEEESTQFFILFFRTMDSPDYWAEQR